MVEVEVGGWNGVLLGGCFLDVKRRGLLEGFLDLVIGDIWVCVFLYVVIINFVFLVDCFIFFWIGYIICVY